MLPYTVGRFRSILENRSLSPLDQRKLARFANKYYRSSNKIGGFQYNRFTGKYSSETQAEGYARQFLKDSTLPYEVKRDIAQILGLEKERLPYEVLPGEGYGPELKQVKEKNKVQIGWPEGSRPVSFHVESFFLRW